MLACGGQSSIFRKYRELAFDSAMLQMPISSMPRTPISQSNISDRIVVTDIISPDIESVAGRQLALNMEELRSLGCLQHWPRQNVSAFDIVQDLKTDTKLFLVGSPASHDPQNQRIEGQSQANNIQFKGEVFYSICWNSEITIVVAMTFSASACGKMEWWSVGEIFPPRVLMVTPAWFQAYKPRLGLLDDL